MDYKDYLKDAAARRAEIAEHYKSSRSLQKTAEVYGITRQRVHAIVKACNKNTGA